MVDVLWAWWCANLFTLALTAHLAQTQQQLQQLAAYSLSCGCRFVDTGEFVFSFAVVWFLSDIMTVITNF